MRISAVILLLLALLLGACRNAPAEHREHMRRDVETVEPENRAELRERLRVTLVGQGQSRPDVDPHMRASAAQGLGNLATVEDYQVLLDGLCGPLADENAMVRMECAIALGKLTYGNAKDESRVAVVRRLRDRLAYDRDEVGRLFEREFLVRVAMVNSLIQIGYRVSASALHDVASRLANDLDGENSQITADASDKGLLDRALGGLARLTGVPEAVAAEQRRKSDDLGPHLAWWAGRIAEMPES